jgi:hypothetical protein
VAREFARNMSLEIGYNFYRSVHIQQVVEVNSQQAPCNVLYPGQYNTAVDPFVGPCYTAKPGTTAGVPNSLVFQNSAFSSLASSRYHGMTASLMRRFSEGLQFQAHYTMSHAEDNTSDYSFLSVPFRPDQMGRDWSTSNFNVAHNFTSNAVYSTPFKRGAGGWARVFADMTVAPIVTARSGIPFTLLVPGLGGASGNGTIGRNSEARPWNEPRNEGRGHPFVSWDMRISKSFYARPERGLRVDLIAQVQNLLNRANFASVNNNFPADPDYRLPGGGNLLSGPYNARGFVPSSVSQLGQPLAFTSTYPPRFISLGLKIGF